MKVENQIINYIYLKDVLGDHLPVTLKTIKSLINKAHWNPIPVSLSPWNVQVSEWRQH